jgi:galactose mutarotase-like enzyme
MPEGIRKEDCSIVFPGKTELRYIQADAAGFAVTREEKLLRLENGCARYQADVPDTWIFENRQVDTVGITGPDHQPIVTLECPQFPILAVWANRNGPFICLEPWFGRTDDEGFAGSIDEKKGIESLESGEKKTVSYTIEFHCFP